MPSPRTLQALARVADLTPRQIVHELDRYIVGQDDAKRAVAIALRNRWRRQHVPEAIRDEISPNNIILVGPTGVGKTEIARRLAKLVGAPFVKVEASKFTEVGYVGRDVESMVRDLVESAIDMVRVEREAEVEELAHDKVDDRLLDLLLPPPAATAPADKPDGKTADGLHMGAMAGSLDVLQRLYLGLNFDVDGLRLLPAPRRGHDAHVWRSRRDWRKIDSRPGRESPMECPKCGARFEQVQVEGETVDRCTGCQGLWFDLEEHEELKAHAGLLDSGDAALGARHDGNDRIACPKCPNSPLIRMVDPAQPHIRFESCTVCYGRFYDAGEFRDFAELTLCERLRLLKPTAFG